MGIKSLTTLLDQHFDIYSREKTYNFILCGRSFLRQVDEQVIFWPNLKKNNSFKFVT